MYLDDLKAGTNTTRTENDALTKKSTLNPLVDFFALAGATRGNEELGLDLFKKAFAFDRLGAVRVLFYLRDVRGGQGERQLFRNCLRDISEHTPEVVEKIVVHIAEYGRWDDLLALDTKYTIKVLAEQLAEDKKTDTPSLLAKWLPSENASSKSSMFKARALAKELKMSQIEYRRLLVSLRKRIGLIEHKLSKREFGSIEYDKIPSQAHLKYKKSFFRNDEDRYTKYLESLKKGETKVNTATLYPYQVYDRAGEVGSDELWKNLPDYTQGKNAIVVADVSGSMEGRPMSVSVSLAIYFAERNKGQFKDHFITFSAEPQLQAIHGKTLREKISSVEQSDWNMNTDVQAVFDLLLNTAVQNNTPVKEMPSTIYIISDMEFDSATSRSIWDRNPKEETNFEAIDKNYREAGYERPNLVFWNVDARNKQVPALADDRNVTLVSGYSPSAFALAVENKTPEQLVKEVIESERYRAIVI